MVPWFKLQGSDAGCGLPPGPGGLLGAAEGLSYLTVGALAIWTVLSKLRTGRSLPDGKLTYCMQSWHKGTARHCTVQELSVCCSMRLCTKHTRFGARPLHLLQPAGCFGLDTFATTLSRIRMSEFVEGLFTVLVFNVYA